MRAHRLIPSITATLIWAMAIAVTAAAAEPRRPNVLVILADDLGFSDLGCYGGEIDTPHLDALAAGGLRFTQGYQTARCWPSRAALLTGYYPQAVNRDALPGGKGGGDGTRPAWARLLPEMLAPAGYRSYHSGKWHVDGDPRAQGFARSLLVDAAAQSNYFTTQALTEDGRPVPETADSYVTTVIGDHAVRCLQDHAAAHAGVPFFHYVAFTAPHFPLHAPADLIAKYRDRYRAGWDALRAARVARLAKAEIVTTPAGEMERGVGLPYGIKDMRERLGPHELDRPEAWAKLTAEQRAFQAEKMAIHAAMVEAMDREVGRIVAALKAAGLFDDTVILFASDNGASAEMLIRGEGHDPAAAPGSRKTFLCLGPGWSSCANAPFRRHKMWNHEGGIATPWIVHWPKGGLDAGGLRRQQVHLIDVAPTVLELTGVAPPATHAGLPVPPMHGRSFVKPLRDPDAAPIHDALWWCHGGHRAVREGDWKLVADREQAWELYDLAADRCETTNVAATHPDRVRALETRWTQIADDCRKLAATAGGEPRAGAPRPPNVVIVFCDDLGYGDPSCYGGKVPTPNIDRIAREGMRFTDFHVPHPVCSASRAALLTGCYSPRVSIHGALVPSATHGIAATETTLAELLRDRGYRTACVGKWHLGHLPEFLPTRHGFDEWLGLPYSNDMWPPNHGKWPPLPLFDGEEVIDPDVTAEDQATLTGRYTARAVDFIERSAKAGDGKPFFLYLAHTMPHVPLFVGQEFRGKSGAGVYGDVVTEIDASVGAVLDSLDRTDRAKDTLVLFTSDNGPWLLFGNHGGSAGPLRDGKATVFEGGIREPCVARLPGVIPAGSVSDALIASIDILPTVAALTGEPLTHDAEGYSLVAGKRIDGHDRRGAFMRTETPAANDAVTHFYYLKTGELQAVRRGRWKLFLPHTASSMAGQEPGRDGRMGKPVPMKIGRELYDLRADVAEQHDVAAKHPEIVAELEQVAEKARRELGDSLTGRKGAGVRPPGGTVASTRPRRPPIENERRWSRRPNIVWLTAEDMSPWIKTYGDGTVPTPHLDRLAREGVVYDNAFATSPVCAPARSSLITGMFCPRIGTMHMRNNGPQQDAMARDPDAYATIPAYEGLPPPFVRCFPETLRAAGYYCTNNDKKDYQFRDPVTVWDESSGHAHWRNRAADQPFFAVFNYGGTHESRAFPNAERSPQVVAAETVPLPPFYPDTPRVRDAVARTYDNIAAFDAWVGARIGELEAAGLLDETVVIFFSDHGVGLPRGKRSCFDTGLRVPLIVRHADGTAAGSREGRVVSFVDFGPTVLSLAGIEPDARLDGTPFLGRFASERDDERRGHAYANADRFDSVYDRARTVSDGRYRYTRNFVPESPYILRNAYREQLPMTADLYRLQETGPERPEQWQIAARQRPVEEFYDSQADPWEVDNLIAAPEHRERIARLRGHLDAWIAATGDMGFVLPEARLVRETIWPPNGVQPTTPVADIVDRAVQQGDSMAFVVSITCADPGASIGYRLGTDRRFTGPWNVYDGPFEVPANRRFLEVQTHRIGHKPAITNAFLGGE